ncbi:hypothetical protein DXB06_11965 [Butyricicoccus sp. OF13-6]|nr:hypothetical protein [Butyricicoccus sp. OF13-6]RHV72702.1 hypothetical protein DXB06_11965 [Butyricicoccus sp. OF13-6]
MHYNGPIIRPHTEANDLFVEVTVGCTHNSCTFCNFYHGYPFRMAPLEQVEADLQEARRCTDDPGRIWRPAATRMPCPPSVWQSWDVCSRNISRTRRWRPMPAWTT